MLTRTDIEELAEEHWYCRGSQAARDEIIAELGGDVDAANDAMLNAGCETAERLWRHRRDWIARAIALLRTAERWERG